MKLRNLAIVAAGMLVATMTACTPGAGHRFGEALQEMEKKPGDRMAEAVVKAHKEQEPALLKLRQLCSAGDQASCIDYQQALASQQADWDNVHAQARADQQSAAIRAASHREKTAADYAPKLENPVHSTTCLNSGP